MPVFVPRFTITNATAMDLTAIKHARGFLEAAKLSEDWIERTSQRALLLEAHHTIRIEGTQLTLAEAARLWAGGEVPGADRDDVCELLNYRGAFSLVAEYLGSGDPITEALIREILKRLVEGTRGERVIRRDVIGRKHGLNERQAVMVEALLERGQLDREEVEALVPGVTRRTLQRDLRGLVEAGIAVAQGAARGPLFVVQSGVTVNCDRIATRIATESRQGSRRGARSCWEAAE